MGYYKDIKFCSGNEHTNRGWHMVVFHLDHHILVHGQSGGVSYRGKDDNSYRKCGGSCQSDRHRVWHLG